MSAVEHKIKPVNHLNILPSSCQRQEGEKGQIVTGKLQMEQICRKAASSMETGAVFVKDDGDYLLSQKNSHIQQGRTVDQTFFLGRYREFDHSAENTQ